ncbi:MAG: hypothetical protein NZ522_02820, partial [Chitinophagales bacterium]|nr:hypothetical protein [Chitinophagales bacterium]
KELEAAVNRCKQAKQLQETSNEDVTEAIKRHQLFKFDKEKIAIWQSDSLLRRYTALDADSFYRLFYSPFSASVLVRTSLPFSQVNFLLEKNFDRWVTADFNPDEIIKIRSIKPMIYTTQNTVLNKSSKHKLSFHTLTFGSRNYARGTYDSYLLSAFLTDTSNKLFQQLKQNTGVQAISTFFDVHNYYGILTVSVELPDTEHRSVYEELRKAIDSAYRYVNDSTLASAKRKFAQEYIVWAKSPDFYYKSLQHFFSNFTEYYETLNDSVQQVPIERFRRFVYNQFSRASFAIIAETDSFHYKNENYEDWMADVDERIGEERFTFRKNICEIEGDENKRLLSRLIQWLKINPDIQCQVNGKADRNEYDKFKDAAVWAFIDTIETFKKYKPDLIKTGIMRPELLRALKILKALYEGGISLERLSGTAMPLNSKTKEEEAANRVATLSLTRLKTLAPLRN